MCGLLFQRMDGGGMDHQIFNFMFFEIAVGFFVLSLVGWLMLGQTPE
jgi:hypothetical protein